jgi:hypothetical protein
MPTPEIVSRNTIILSLRAMHFIPLVISRCCTSVSAQSFVLALC